MKPTERARLLERVAQVYHRSMRKNPGAGDALKQWNLNSPGLIEVFQIGFCPGTLHELLPSDGDAVECLKSLGILDSDGAERLTGCIVVPLKDTGGTVRGFYGRELSHSSGKEHIIPENWQGIFNAHGIRGQKQVVVVDHVLDVLSLWNAGFHGTAGLIGSDAQIGELQKAISARQPEVIVCLRRPAVDLKQELLASGVSCVRILEWPEGIQGAFDYFQKHSRDDFRQLIRTSESGTKQQVVYTDTGFTLNLGNRCYEIRSIERPSPSRLRGTLRARVGSGRFVLDTVDFYQARSRRGFISETARLFDQEIEVIEGDINRIMELMEQALERQQRPAVPLSMTLTEADQEEGLRLGRNADLKGEILKDMEALGMIGETANKLIGYLVMTSRKMTDPLALLILSGSGAGKSHLQDTVLGLCPEEDKVRLTSVTDRALFYKDSDSLRNKVLALEEAVGAAKGADYALRNLISARQLTIESTVKNAGTGKLETQVNIVHGPTAVFLTTTNPDADAETRSRFLVISVDESSEQTRAILKLQRQTQTLQGRRQCRERDALLRRHHCLQRMLRPLAVVNPYAHLLSFPGDRLQVRRDQPKYLQLILAVTFLHQFQRSLKHEPEIGDYVETTLEDIELANELAHHLFGHTVEDLSRPAQELLERIWAYAQHKAQQDGIDRVSFNRRELREAFRWGDTRLRTHLKELVRMEYLVPISGRFGQTYHYRLVGEPLTHGSAERRMPGLKSIDEIRQAANLAVSHPPRRSGSARLRDTQVTSAEGLPTQPGPTSHVDRKVLLRQHHKTPRA